MTKSPRPRRSKNKSPISRVRKKLKKTATLKAILIIALFLYLTTHFFKDLNTHIFHLDEQEFMRKSYYFDLFFIRRDLSDPRWYTEDAPPQPKLGPYIYGVTLHLTGITDIEKKLKETAFDVFEPGGNHWKFRWLNKPLINVPPDLLPKLQLIWIGRSTSVLFTLASLGVLFLLSKRIGGFLYGLLATYFLGTNPLLFLYGRRAMTDSMQLLFFFVNLLLSLIFLEAVKSNNQRKQMVVSLSLGVNAALGVGVKVSGIMIVIFLSLLITLLFVLRYRQKKPVTYLFLSIAIMAVSFSVVMVSLHPYLYRNPPKQFISMFTERLSYAHEHQLEFPKYAVYSRWEAVRLTVKQTLSATGPYINFRVRKFPLDAVLFIVGLWYLAEKAYDDFYKKKKVSGEALLLLWAAVVIVSLVFYLRNNWPRYLIPTESVITIIQAYAIAVLVHELWPHAIKKLKVKSQTRKRRSISLKRTSRGSRR